MKGKELCGKKKNKNNTKRLKSEAKYHKANARGQREGWRHVGSGGGKDEKEVGASGLLMKIWLRFLPVFY